MKNIFFKKNVLILRKEIYSSYYDILLKGLVDFGNPKNIYTVKFNSKSNFEKVNQELIRISKEKEIDIFVAASFYIILPKTFKNMRSIFKIRIDGDDSSMFDFYSKWYAQFFDLNLTSSLEAKLKFDKFNFRTIVFANMINIENISYPKETMNPSMEVSFIGAIKKKIDREGYLNFLIENNINILTFGIDSNSGYLNTSQKYEIYNKSKINLNFSGISIIRNNKAEKITTMQGRIFEIMAVGGFVLTENTPTIDLFFKRRVHLDVFNNQNELLEKINYYLNNDSIRIRIAQEGKKHFFAYYEYNKYIPVLINQISSNYNKKEFNDDYLWPKELKNFLSQFVNYKHFNNLQYINSVFKHIGFKSYLKNRFYRVLSLFSKNSYF